MEFSQIFGKSQTLKQSMRKGTSKACLTIYQFYFYQYVAKCMEGLYLIQSLHFLIEKKNKLQSPNQSSFCPKGSCENQLL